MAQRDSYDKYTLWFQIVVAVIGGLFTWVQFQATRIESDKNAQDKAIEESQASSDREEQRRETVSKLLFEAVGQSSSSDADQRRRGLGQLNLISSPSFFKSLDLDPNAEPDLKKLLDISQNNSVSTYAAIGQSGTASETKQVSTLSCSQRLKKYNAAATPGAPGDECWIYLGWYKGNISRGICTEVGAWATQYLTFDPHVCPSKLLGTYLAVSDKTGALYVRSAPATPTSIAPAVGGLYAKQQVEIDQIISSVPNTGFDQNKNSAVGSGQLWGRIATIKN